jgi:hypothetical protein
VPARFLRPSRQGRSRWRFASVCGLAAAAAESAALPAMPRREALPPADLAARLAAGSLAQPCLRARLFGAGNAGRLARRIEAEGLPALGRARCSRRPGPLSAAGRPFATAAGRDAVAVARSRGREQARGSKEAT